jgi:hypothetical protein
VARNVLIEVLGARASFCIRGHFSG